jgi:SAM-dependent methyltransferase
MADTGQLTGSAAEVYDEFFLPALFEAWPPHLVEAAGLQPGMRVLDVACGTGVLAQEAARAVGPEGHVVGVDLNPGMLAVARQKAPEGDWRQGPAEDLPLEGEDFDAVVSQFGLMFFRDRRGAVREMWRVLRPGGRMAVAVWDALLNTPGYTAAVRLLGRLFGSQTADLLRAPYELGDPQALQSLWRSAGLPTPEVRRVQGEARFPSIRSWMHTDVRGWTLSDKIDDEQFEELVTAAETDLARFVQPDGSVRFAHPALVVTAHKEMGEEAVN